MANARLSHAGAAVITALTDPITSGDTAATIDDATDWSTLGGTGPFYISIFEQSGTTRLNEEKILVTSISGVGLAGMTRGQDGTSAVNHVAGSVVEHVFTAAEADEANKMVASFLGAITTKGDAIVGTGSQTVAREAVGSDDQVLIADSNQTTGRKWASVDTPQIADGAITSAKITDGTIVGGDIADGTLTEAKMSSAFWKRTTFSVTSGASGVSTIPHGASFTPTFYQIMFTGPIASPHFVGGWVQYSAPDSVNVTVRVSAAADTGGLLASGQTLTGIILSFA